MRKILIGMSLTAALLAGCSSSSSTDTTVAVETIDTAAVTTAVVEINLIVGENTGPDMKQTVPLGSSVRITFINPNGPDEIHVHGYDLTTGEMAMGQESVIEFVASNAGTFDIESHISEEVVFVLTVE
jgi:hypothetical protein